MDFRRGIGDGGGEAKSVQGGKSLTLSHRETLGNIPVGIHFSSVLTVSPASSSSLLFLNFNCVIFIYYCFYFSPKLKFITRSFSGCLSANTP